MMLLDITVTLTYGCI